MHRVARWLVPVLDSFHFTPESSDRPEGDPNEAALRRPDHPSPSHSLGLASSRPEDQPTEPVVLVVSHGAWISAFLHVIEWFGFNREPEDQQKRHCLNTSITILKCWPSTRKDMWYRRKWFASLGADEQQRRKVTSIGWSGGLVQWADAEHLRGLCDEVMSDAPEVVDDVKEDEMPRAAGKAAQRNEDRGRRHDLPNVNVAARRATSRDGRCNTG